MVATGRNSSSSLDGRDTNPKCWQKLFAFWSLASTKSPMPPARLKISINFFIAATSRIFPMPCPCRFLETASRPNRTPDTLRGSFFASSAARDSDLIWHRLSEKKPRMDLGSEASSSTNTKVREMPRAACWRAVCFRNRLSGKVRFRSVLIV